MTITILPQAGCDLFCWRCRTLGIATPTILKGNAYVKVEANGRIRTACLDCYERLQEECQAMD